MASIFYYGHVDLCRTRDGERKARSSLLHPEHTFGRMSDCDLVIEVETCSRYHATIRVDPEEPYAAAIHVQGANGVVVNKKLYGKGAVVPLNDGDKFEISKQFFVWARASRVQVQINTPTTKRFDGAYTLFGSPSPWSSPSKSRSTSPADEGIMLDGCLSVDNNAEREEGDDLIVCSWQQEEDERDLDDVDEPEETQQDDQQAPQTPSRAPSSITSTPSLSQRARSIRPPTSEARPKANPTAPSNRRMSEYRITIVPANNAATWLRERDARVQMEAAANKALEISIRAHLADPTSPVHNTPASSPSVRSTNSSAHSSKSSTPRVSSTSRRISALLLSGSGRSSGSSRRSSASFGHASGGEESDSSDEEEGEEVPVALPFPGQAEAAASASESEESESEEEREEVQEDMEVPVNFESAEPAPEEVESDNSDADEDVYADVDADDDEARSLAIAASVPLPPSPSVTPVPSPTANNTLQRIPRHSTTRRLSLREKVLIRGAHATLVSPVLAPAPVATPPQLNAAPEDESAIDDDDLDAEGEEDVEMADGEADWPAGEAELEREGHEEEDVEEPEAPVVVPSTPGWSPSRHRDSIELTKSRSPKKVDSPVVQSATRVEFSSTRSQAINLPGSPVMAASDELAEDGPPSPSPAARHHTPARKPRDSVALAKHHLAHASSVPLPETPAGTTPWTLGTPVAVSPAPVAAALLATPPQNTPRAFARSPASAQLFGVASSPSKLFQESLNSFQREMMSSPMNHHRTMATPKSALRLGQLKGRRKSFRGFLSPAPPPASARKVAFNDQLFIQPIYDLPTLCSPNFLGAPAAVPLLGSPAPAQRQAQREPVLDQPSTPRPVPAGQPTFVFAEQPATPVASGSGSTPSSTVRRAARVPAPADAQPIFPPTSRAFALPRGGRAAETPTRRAGRVLVSVPLEASHAPAPAPVFTSPVCLEAPVQPRAASPSAGSAISFGRSRSAGSNGRSLAELLASPGPVVPEYHRPANRRGEMLARIEALRRKSMPGQDNRYQMPIFDSPSVSRPPVDLFVRPTPKGTPAPTPKEPAKHINDDAAAPSTPSRTAPAPTGSSNRLPSFDAVGSPCRPFRPTAAPATPRFEPEEPESVEDAAPVQESELEPEPEPLPAFVVEEELAPTPVFEVQEEEEELEPALVTPLRSNGKGAERTLVASPMVVEPVVEPEQEEEHQNEEEEPESPTEGLDADALGTQDVGLEADLARASALKESFLEEVSPPVSPRNRVEERVEEPEEEEAAASFEEEAALVVVAEPSSAVERDEEPLVDEEELVVEVEEPVVEEPIIDTEEPVVEVEEPSVVEAASEEPSPEVDEAAPEPEIEVAPAAVEEQAEEEPVEEEVEEEVVPVKKGRGRAAATPKAKKAKAPAKKSGIPTRGRKAATPAVVEEEHDEEEEEQVEEEPSPVVAKRGRTKPVSKATPAAAKRGKAAKAAEETDAEPTPIVTPKTTAGRRAKKATEDDEPTPAPAASSIPRTKRGAKKVVVEVIVPVTPAASSSSTEKGTSSRRRGKAATITIHEDDEIPPVPVLPSLDAAVEEPPIASTSRGKHVLKPSTPDVSDAELDHVVAAKAAPKPRGRPKAVTTAASEEHDVKENAVVKGRKALPRRVTAAPSVVEPVEPVTTGRALRSRR